jgi:hypothetical protein
VRFAPARTRADRDSSAARREAVTPPRPQQSDGAQRTTSRSAPSLFCALPTLNNCEFGTVEASPIPLAVDSSLFFGLPGSGLCAAKPRVGGPAGAVPSEASARGGNKTKLGKGKNGAPLVVSEVVTRLRKHVSRLD